MNKLLILTGVSVSLLIFLASTSPQQVILPLLLVPFITIGFLIYLVLNSFRLENRLNNRVTSRIIPATIAMFIVMLLLLSSLGQLTLRDILLVVGFCVLFVVYMRRADFLK